MIGEALLAGGAIALYFLFRGRSSTGETVSEKDAALNDQLYKDMMATGSSLDDQLLKDMMAAGGWIPIPPGEISSAPSKKSGFTKGETAYVALQRSGTDSVVVSAVRIDEVLGDESTGPIGRGKTYSLATAFGAAGVKPPPSMKIGDNEQISGSEQPKLGTVVALPIAYRLDDPPTE